MKKLFLGMFLSSLAVVPMASGAADKAPKKVLIVYYSMTGNTDYIAQKLQKKTGADMFRLETVKPYPKGDNEFPKKERESGKLPDLKKLPDNLGSYDIILVGTPVWWYSASNPVQSFLKQADFKGKKMAAFSTHGGGLGKTFSDMKAQAKNAVFIDGGLDFYKPRQDSEERVDQAIDEWLANVMK